MIQMAVQWGCHFVYGLWAFEFLSFRKKETLFKIKEFVTFIYIKMFIFNMYFKNFSL